MLSTSSASAARHVARMSSTVATCGCSCTPTLKRAIELSFRWTDGTARHTTGAMFITNHVLAGTIAGTALRRCPLLAFGVGFATHVAMDLTPHWGNPTLGRDGFYAVAKRDGVLGLGAI